MELTVDRLFRVAKEVALPGGKRVWVRALSDYESQMRYRLALLARVNLEQALKDQNSTEYRTTLLPLEGADVEVLRATLLMYWRRQAIQDAQREIVLEYIPFPDDPSQAEESDVLARRKGAEAGLPEKRKEFVENTLAKLAKAWEAKGREELYAECALLTKETQAEAAFTSEHIYQTLYMAVMKGLNGDRYFASVEEVRNLPTQVMGVLADAFSEVNDIDPLSLNMPPATESSPA